MIDYMAPENGSALCRLQLRFASKAGAFFCHSCSGEYLDPSSGSRTWGLPVGDRTIRSKVGLGAGGDRLRDFCYLLQLFAATSDAQDPRRRKLIESVIEDLNRLAK